MRSDIKNGTERMSVMDGMLKECLLSDAQYYGKRFGCFRDRAHPSHLILIVFEQISRLN